MRQNALSLMWQRAYAVCALVVPRITSREGLGMKTDSKRHSRIARRGAHFIVGGGETGELMRRMRWSETGLGSADGWPTSLRAAVQLSQATKFPSSVMWGPERLFLYNEACIPLMSRGAHPHAMGQPVLDLHPEAAAALGPVLDEVYTKGESVLVENLRVTLEHGTEPVEAYFSATYSPIHGESGAVEGVFCIAVEATSQVIGARRLHLLNTLCERVDARCPREACALAAAAMAHASSDIPFALLYLADEAAGRFELAGAANVPPDSSFAPSFIAFGDERVWPVESARTNGPREVALPRSPGGARGARIMPLDGRATEAPLGFIVVGLSAVLPVTDTYEHFHTLLATRVSQNVRNASSREAASLEQTRREDLYQNFMQAPFPVCVTRGPMHAVELANPPMRRVWFDRDVTGKPLLEALPELADQPFIGYLDDVYRTGVTYTAEAARARLAPEPGEPPRDVWYSFVYAPYRGVSGAVEGILVSAMDVTDVVVARERSEAARLEADAAADVQRALREFQERFVAVLGHDLRNPLSSIGMATELLSHSAEESGDAMVARLSLRMRSSVRRMTKMIEQIVDLSRSRLGGGFDVRPRPVDMKTLLSAVVNELRLSHPSVKIALRVPSIKGAWDRPRLEQVFSNLIGNAIHHGREGAEVSVEVEEADESVEVRVHNEGDAIPAELLAMLFEPFRRGERSLREPHAEGLGLGLYISREIVLAHGGALTVSSDVSRGTTFAVRLPRLSEPRCRVGVAR